MGIAIRIIEIKKYHIFSKLESTGFHRLKNAQSGFTSSVAVPGIAATPKKMGINICK
jgi:hypothetical protein